MLQHINDFWNFISTHSISNLVFKPGSSLDQEIKDAEILNLKSTYYIEAGDQRKSNKRK